LGQNSDELVQLCIILHFNFISNMNVHSPELLARRLEVGARLRKFREESGLTQAQLADKMQVESTTVSKIEAGKWNFTIDFLNLFIENLELTLTIDKK